MKPRDEWYWVPIPCSAYFLADSYLKYVGWTLFDKASLSPCATLSASLISTLVSSSCRWERCDWPVCRC